jgi:hypothetical protein
MYQVFESIYLGRKDHNRGEGESLIVSKKNGRANVGIIIRF